MFNINNNAPTYDPVSVQPMRDELLYVGFKELTTAEEVSDALTADGKTKFVVINSVCGCAAGSARPGATLALQSKIIPDEFYTVFAGQDKQAVQKFRTEFLGNFPPSSPCMALIRDKEVLFFLPRYHIEGRTAEQIAEILTDVFKEHCSSEGPSVTAEEYSKLIHAKACGSRIPLNTTDN